MGFWDSALKVAKNAGTVIASQLEQSANETRELREKHEALGDDELLRIARSTKSWSISQKERAVAYRTLTQRGYTPDDIKQSN
ncbi:hypothetical protein GHR37_19250 [Achromobacter xylosoxidans]|nr:hypothetical protein [Achromobacter xylosoxidans]